MARALDPVCACYKWLPLEISCIPRSCGQWSGSNCRYFASGSSANGRLHCRRDGLPCTSINFGPFAGVGMAASYADSMQAIGLPPLPPPACPEAFASAGYSGRLIRARIHVARFAQVNQAKGKWTYVSSLAMVPQV